MSSVMLSFSPVPAQVRTARLLAVALGRRSGMPDDLVDEVRLAVGEACSRAVAVHARAHDAGRIRVEFVEDERGYAVTVTDNGKAAAVDKVPDLSWEDLGTGAQDELADRGPLPAGLDLAVVCGLVDDMRVSPSPSGAPMCCCAGRAEQAWTAPATRCRGAPLAGPFGVPGTGRLGALATISAGSCVRAGSHRGSMTGFGCGVPGSLPAIGL